MVFLCAKIAPVSLIPQANTAFRGPRSVPFPTFRLYVTYAHFLNRLKTARNSRWPGPYAS